MRRVLPTVALLSPGVAPHMIAVAFPEPGAIQGEKFQAGHPLGALPGVEQGDDQPGRPAMVYR